jgi:hypothetical protein
MTDNISWTFLASELTSMGELEVLNLLRDEQEGAKRPYIVRRLHQRYTALRNRRERAEIMARLAE